MAKRAYVFDTTQFLMSPNGDMILQAQTMYWEENGGQLISDLDPQWVAVTITPSMTESQINNALINTVKAHALTMFGWDMTANSVLAPRINRG